MNAPEARLIGVFALGMKFIRFSTDLMSKLSKDQLIEVAVRLSSSGFRDAQSPLRKSVLLLGVHGYK